MKGAPTRMDIGFKTDKGKRRSNNEDACYVMPRDRIFVIADGVGGSKSGEIASRTAVTGVVNFVKSHDLSENATEREIRQYFESCVKDINFAVLESSQKYEQNYGMATTVVISYVNNNKMYVINVGDSRAYIVRNGRITQITEDHTYVNSLLKAGVLTEKEAETHENKNMITKAVGADHIIEPDFFVTSVIPGDIILLCTDGLYGELTSEEIISRINMNKSMGETCEELIKLANLNGGNDNITVICLKVTEDDINE